MSSGCACRRRLAFYLCIASVLSGYVVIFYLSGRFFPIKPVLLDTNNACILITCISYLMSASEFHIRPLRVCFYLFVTICLLFAIPDATYSDGECTTGQCQNTLGRCVNCKGDNGKSYDIMRALGYD